MARPLRGYFCRRHADMAGLAARFTLELCGIQLRPVPGLHQRHDMFPTANAVGFYLSPERRDKPA